MSAIAQCHRSAVKTRPSTPRAPPEPTQKKPDVGPYFRRTDCAKPSQAGEGAQRRSPHRQCSNRVSSQLINFPTASPNSDRITTPASS